MSYLKKAYEISVWKDELNGTSFEEKRVAIIGSDQMESPSRAQSPKFVKKVNGEKQLTFSMYSQYIDPITGENTHNPFADLLDNETKLKLKYRGKWYDLIIKNVEEDSTSKTKTYTATDQFVIELSKNGYDLELDTSLMNNTGNLVELAREVLKDTDWEVSEQSENPKQYIEEQLVEFLYQDRTIYAFFSSCKEQPNYFQYITELGAINSENVYDNATQTYIDVAKQMLSYTTSSEAIKYGFSYPVGFEFVQLTDLRANRIVYTHKSKFNSALNKIVYSYDGGDIEGYSTTEYITPNLVTNLITNNTFRSTSGWTGSCLAPSGQTEIEDGKQVKLSNSKNKANVESIAIDTTGKDLISAFKEGVGLENIYTPHLKVEFQSKYSVLVNSGFYDNRTIIKNLAPNQRFVLLFKVESVRSVQKNVENPRNQLLQLSQYFPNIKIGVGNYSVNDGRYVSLDQTFISFDKTPSGAILPNKYNDYICIYGTVPSNYAITSEKAYEKLKTQLFITGPAGFDYNNYNLIYTFADFQIFPYVNNDGNPLMPDGDDDDESAIEPKISTTYYYYKVKDNPQNPSAAGYRASEQEYRYSAISDRPSDIYQPDYTTDKVLSISVKQSNYFNAIQSLCETFEAWADFEIERNADGTIISKKIVFKENLENPNYLGFKYGVNLKSSKRSIDSKAIVTKLIVPNNTNEFAKNGFCSIARAGANTSGENYIIDFSYYYNFGKLDKNAMHEFFFRPRQESDTDELQGYYIQLSVLNSELNTYLDRYSALAVPLMQAEADKQVAESGRDAAQEKYEELSETFLKTSGYDHMSINNDEEKINQINASSSLKKYLTELSEYYSSWQKYTIEVENTTKTYNKYKTLNDNLVKRIENINAQKEELYKKFYKRFYRFIQEGTWKDDKYIEDDKYYSDAVSTAANSALPKVTYTFGVIDIGQISEYEDFQFELGDKTWVEDPDLFGNEREEVVITEITYELEEPDKSSIKIQNHKDQFSSLFQKVTATTQSVQYAAGQWNKAADFANANPVDQAAFLQSALTDAETKLQNAGDQSVVWDKTGITVTDLISPNEQIRIIGGAIMLRSPDGDGLGWTTAITAKGINAKIITTGQLNTGNITIMSGDEPYFRWDAMGITAYYFDSNPQEQGGYLYGLNTKKGVRFDRFGIYGYNGIDGSVWHPNSFKDIKEYSLFALTWDGLYLNFGHGTYDVGFDQVSGQEVTLNKVWHITKTQLGKVGKYLYNTWTDDGYPSYDSSLVGKPNHPNFAKVFTIADESDNEQLVIYDDGTLVANKVRLTGGVSWSAEASPARSIYGTSDLMNYPAPNNWPYEEIPEHDPRASGNSGGIDLTRCWHRTKGKDDVLYCHTDTAGTIWDGPFLITGRSIEQTITEYSVQNNIRKPENILSSEWSISFPSEINPGQYLYIRSRDKYSDNTYSSFRYSSSFHGSEAIQCYIDCPLGNPISADVPNDTRTTLTAQMFRGNEELDPNGDQYTYHWYINGVLRQETIQQITLRVGDLRNAEIYFEAEQKKTQE